MKAQELKNKIAIAKANMDFVTVGRLQAELDDLPESEKNNYNPCDVFGNTDMGSNNEDMSKLFNNLFGNGGMFGKK